MYERILQSASVRKTGEGRRGFDEPIPWVKNPYKYFFYNELYGVKMYLIGWVLGS